MSTTFMVSPEHGVMLLDPDTGWRRPENGECIETEGGNYIQFNSAGFYSGLFYGYGAGLLSAFAVLIIAAIWVTA